ncbi:MAG: hypothetical protein AB7M12_09265 [Hyphomonadaceae bacterium]
MKAFKTAVVALAFGAAGALFAQSTFAQSAAPSVAPPAVQKICDEDAKKFCPGLTGPERFKCMTEHQPQLSKPCADAAAAAMPSVTPPAK